MTELERFEAKYLVDGKGCWVWQANLTKQDGNGYGRFCVDGKMLLAHRWAYEHFRGSLPPAVWKDGTRMELDHLCRNRLCVNPSHLEIVDNAINHQRGRGTDMNAMRSKMMKLTEADVREIRTRYGEGHLTQTALADEYGVCQAHISDVISGASWSKV